MSAAEPEPLDRVERIKGAYLGALAFPTGLSLLLFIGVASFVALLIARGGTLVSRAGAGVLLGAVALACVGWAIRRRRRMADPLRALRASLSQVDPKGAERAVRALSTWVRLSKSSTRGGESPELARLHVDRVFEPFTPSEVVRSLKEARRRRFWLVLVLACVFATFILTRALALIEGAGVLFAQRGVAPFPVAYITSIQVAAEWPSYLDGTGKKRGLSPRLATVPQGSEVEIRVVPFVLDRDLILTDGINEQPLLSDGKGGLVARWKAEDPSGLRVAARFGDVLVFDAHETQVAPLHDRAPAVLLSGAPKELKLVDLESLELSFSAADDHGLTQIDLVLRSGQRESRSELASLDGRQKSYRGGHRLTREHPLLRRAFLPVRVTVEARDNNVATGPSWGESASYLLLPPPLGDEVAIRHVALREFRSKVATYLARDVAADHLTLAASQSEKELAHVELLAAFDELRGTLESQKTVPKSSLAFVSAQVEALNAKGKERASSEAVLLGVDAR